MNGKTSGLFCAIARFTDKQGKPLKGSGWRADLRDQDALLDDCLGEVRLDSEGKATFLVAVADIKSMDSWGERDPDLYFTLYRDGEAVFRSEIIEDVDFEELDRVSGDPDKITQEFGPYAISLDS